MSTPKRSHKKKPESLSPVQPTTAQVAEIARLKQELAECREDIAFLNKEKEIGQRNLQAAQDHAENMRKDLLDANKKIITREDIRQASLTDIRAAHSNDLAELRKDHENETAKLNANLELLSGQKRQAMIEVDAVHSLLDAMPAPPPRIMETPLNDEQELSISQRLLVFVGRQR